MLIEQIAQSAIVAIWVCFAFVLWALGTIMRNNSDVQQQKVLGRANIGFLPSSFRAISSYLRIVSSGASTVARSAASVAQSIVDRDDASHDQVYWAGFDKLEGKGDVIRQVLLLGYRSGFQVWDVEEADNVRELVSRHDGPVSCLQMLPKPMASKRSRDNYADNRPLLAVCADEAPFGGSMHDGLVTPRNGSIPNYHVLSNCSAMATVVRFYSLKSQSFVHVLKFRSVIYSVRCSSRIVAISLAAQIHCFDATTLEREYTVLTNPIVTGPPGSGCLGHGPLAVGPRWLAYSGSPVVVLNSGCVSPQHITPTASFSGFTSNGSFVVHYAKESSKQLATGIMTLGDMGYKKLSRYCSELLPDSHGSLQSGKGNGTVNGHLPDADSIGMVVVRDIVNKHVISQFRAHKSPISALCFDPSGTILVTASVQGHNVNVFKIMPGLQGSSYAGDAAASYTHLYRLQRGLTNAVIQDISFSDDSNWIMISSSRGTGHLFAINPLGGSVNFQSSDASFISKSSGVAVIPQSVGYFPPGLGSQVHNQQSLCASGSPVALNAVSRIRNGNNGWRGTVSGAAAAATGRLSSVSGAIASSFHNCRANTNLYVDGTPLKTNSHLLVFSPSGCMIQYALRAFDGVDSTTVASGLNMADVPSPDTDGRLIVEAIQKWNLCQKRNRREQEDNVDIYGENGNSDSCKIYPEGMRNGNDIHFHSECEVAIARTRIIPEDKQHLYISEAELQMHQVHIPLWAKPKLHFQSMMSDWIIMGEANLRQGEIEIEMIPTCTIEVRSKDLVPVFNHLQIPQFQRARVFAFQSKNSGHLQHQRSGLSENGWLSRRSSSASLDRTTNSGTGVAELHNMVEENGWNSPKMPTETTGIVKNDDSP